jgi:hypothetical protein
MRFLSLAVLAASAASALAGTITNPFSPIPGYPLGNGICLTDQQSNFLVNTFVGALANTNRAATNTTMQTLLASNYAESSDSINILAGYQVSSPSRPMCNQSNLPCSSTPSPSPAKPHTSPPSSTRHPHHPLRSSRSSTTAPISASAGLSTGSARVLTRSKALINL